MIKENKNLAIAGTEVKIENYPATLEKKIVMENILKFIDVANTSTDRATFYNTKEEQKKAAEIIHNNLYKTNRGIYAATLLLDGITDNTKMIGIKKLLKESSENERDYSMLPLSTESKIIAYVTSTLPVQRMLNIYLELRNERINNSRTRKIILYSILSSKNLEYWIVKYRGKIKISIEHAFGKRQMSILGSILTRQDFNNFVFTEKEKNILKSVVDKYIGNNVSSYVYQCLAFLFNTNKEFKLNVLKSFVEAKTDITKGDKLPREILEGIRSIYHKEVSSAKVLELTKQQLTEKEKMKVQKNATEHNVKVEFDVTKQSAVDLYIHCFANDNTISPEIKKVLKEKAGRTAKNIPLSYNKIGVLVDSSLSSTGSKTQNLRPIAITLAIRDLLMATAKKSFIEYAGGVELNNGLILPCGETNLAPSLVKLLKAKPDAIFIISDGYENAPAGRVNEVIAAVRGMGIETPIFQISPVMSMEAGGVKKLSGEVSVLPVSKPEAIGFSIVKALLETDVREGVISLFSITLPKLLN